MPVASQSFPTTILYCSRPINSARTLSWLVRSMWEKLLHDTGAIPFGTDTNCFYAKEVASEVYDHRHERNKMEGDFETMEDGYNQRRWIFDAGAEWSMDPVLQPFPSIYELTTSLTGWLRASRDQEPFLNKPMETHTKILR